jgi:nucleoside-diphosphate-sugar epimerase
MTKVALVAGGLGVVGRALLEHLEGEQDWEVIALSRRAPDFPTRARFIAVDLADRANCEAKLNGLADVTHVFFAAYAPKPTLAEEAVHNTAMLVNLIETLDEQGMPALEHVHLMHGSKWYGNHLGPYRTPAKEDDAGHLPPNFYFDQQAWIEARQEGESWTWSAFRPHGICGLAIGSSMNQLTAMALYAAVMKHLDRPLRFPGTPGFFNVVYQMTESAYLARGMVFASTSPTCANQAFNFTNGDLIRWCHLWPKVADFFEMAPDGVQTIPLQTFMADKEPVWAEIRERHGLKDYTLEQLTNWRFADFVFSCDYDQISDLTRIRNAGWTGANDSEAMYLRLLAGLRAERIIP